MAFPGAILPAWGYHLNYNFAEVGRFFLFVAAGVIGAAPAGERVARKNGIATALALGCGVAAVSLAGLSQTGPHAPWWWRAAGLAGVGMGAGILHSAAFRSLSSLYDREPAATVNMAGTLFGLGSFAMAMIASGALFVYTPASTLLLLAAIPALGAGLYWRSASAAPVPHLERGVAEVLNDVRSPGAVLFSLLLFLQFGNEWSVAAWVAVFLVHRVGVSPETALHMLALYWLALTLGRIAAQALLARIGHGALLFSSAFAAMIGSLVVAFTNNVFGAWSGLLLMGLGFAAIYPLVTEKIGHRFPDYHPGFFNGLLSFGIMGGLVTPWILGYLAGQWGIQTVMLAPFIGSFLVLVLILLLWLETKLTGSKR